MFETFLTAEVLIQKSFFRKADLMSICEISSMLMSAMWTTGVHGQVMLRSVKAALKHLQIKKTLNHEIFE